MVDVGTATQITTASKRIGVLEGGYLGKKPVSV
jgi:hypothetical protein